MGDNPFRKSPAFATAEEYHSSSEYSSPEIQENEEPPSPVNASRPGATENNETHNNHNRAHSDDWRAANAVWRRPESSKTRNDRQEDWGTAIAAWRRPPSPGADGYPTSEESGDEDRGPNHVSRHDTGRITNHSRGSPTGARGKKGLTHEEMAIMGRGGGELEEGTDDADNYHYTDENGRGIDGRSSDVRDEGDDTEEVEDSDEMSQRSTDRESSRAKAWSDCHPVVLEAVRILNAKSADPAELGYARLASAGKGAVDYIVRKRSITIGRSASTSDCTIKSEGRYISRRHAMLFWKPEEKEWAIRCLSDKNGILVNGVPVVRGSDSIPVKSRDLIEVGDVAFFFLAATSPVVRINSITALDRTIRTIQQGEDYDRSEYFHAKKNDSRTGRQKGSNTNRLYGNERKKRAQDKSKLRLNVGRLDGFSGTKKRRRSTASGGLGDAQHLQKSQKRWKKSQKAKNRAGLAENASTRESDDDGRTDEDDPDVTEEEEEDVKQKTWLDEKANRGFGSLFGSTSLRPQQDLMSIENKEERRERRDRHARNWADEHPREPPSKYRDDWNKKERTDFGRALFAVGVDPVYDDDGSVPFYDWTRFRKIAGLSKKSDLMLEDYYIRMMTDVRSLLEEEEQEKRTKGPRTKHKPGCDCVVCENTRKSRRKKREERENSAMDELPDEESDGEDEAAVKSSAKSSGKLVGLVTAQKLRVRLSIHDAARQVLNGAGKVLFKKLSEQPVRGFPRWWRPGIHDKALMRGTAIHGVAQWSDIWNDPRQKVFRKQKEEDGDAIVWPSNQAAMKRVRDISSGINAELRREAKRAAKGDHVSGRDVYYRQNRHKRANTAREEKAFQRRKKASRRSNLSADEYEDVMSDGGENVDGESTVESASEIPEIEDQGAADVPTEDDDVLEMEVEEEMEIEDNGDNGEETEEESSKGQAVEKPIEARSNVGDNWTDEEEDDEDVIQYETASDSGSE